MPHYWMRPHGRMMRNCFAVVALVASLCRALIPVGFMPMTVNGETRMMLCDGGASRHMQPGHSGSHSTHLTYCPFAQSASPAPLPAALQGSIIRLDSPLNAPPLEQESSHPNPPPRYSSPRGPPRSSD